MTTYPIDDEFDDINWDDDDPNYDPFHCPNCGNDTILDGDWCYCIDTNECGWSDYLGDDEDGDE